MTDNDKGVLVGTLTESLEDYLEIIFLLLQEKKVARVRDIAKAKNVKTSSVTSALHRLAQEGLVDYHAREYVDLTDDGREFAFRVYQRHTFLKRFLVDLLQVDPETAEQDACSMEHVLSVTTLDRMSSFAEFISYCPKVDERLIGEFRDSWLEGTRELTKCKESKEGGIWKQKGELLSKLGIQSLADLEPGARGYIARIIGPDDIRRRLIQRGMLPATSIFLQARSGDGSYNLTISGESIQLTPTEAAMVYIWVAKEALTQTVGAQESITSLADVKPGHRYNVLKLKAEGETRQRLLDMGFVKGASGRMLRESVLRDPIEIELGCNLLSIRREEAASIMVEEINEPPSANN